MKSVIGTLHKYADFNGRASRAEFLYFILFLISALVILLILNSIFSSENGVPIFLFLTFILFLLLLVPYISIITRRLHDTGKSGWWQLIGSVPVVGQIIFLFLVLSSGDEGPNQYGSDPKTGSVETNAVATAATEMTKNEHQTPTTMDDTTDLGNTGNRPS